MLIKFYISILAFGCDANMTQVSLDMSLNSSVGSMAGGEPQTLGVLAMCCVNELLAKNCVPAEFEDFLLQMFQQTFYLLQVRIFL